MGLENRISTEPAFDVESASDDSDGDFTDNLHMYDMLTPVNHCAKSKESVYP